MNAPLKICCHSSAVEHFIGNEEVGGSIPLDSTRYSHLSQNLSQLSYSILKPLLFKLKPETAHNLAIWALKHNLVVAPKNLEYPTLETKVFDLEFKNPIGMAAGFDKNAAIFHQLFKFGFGFVEVGTVTPKPQLGNEKPRIFRLEEDLAIINRLGFNNLGIENFLRNIQNNFQSVKANEQCPLGINIGKNKDTQNAIDDYSLLLKQTYGKSDYITINISSPNTKNLRDLQKSDELDLFLKGIIAEKNILLEQQKNIPKLLESDKASFGLGSLQSGAAAVRRENIKNITKSKGFGDIPILLKIAPDLIWQEQEAIADLVLKHQIDGLIIGNTTISRPENLISEHKIETGGLSGKPLFEISNMVLQNIYGLTKGKIPIIAAGGVCSGKDAYHKIKLGASLVQVYSAFIYQGFELVEQIKKDLDIALRKDGLKNINQAIGILAR